MYDWHGFENQPLRGRIGLGAVQGVKVQEVRQALGRVEFYWFRDLEYTN